MMNFSKAIFVFLILAIPFISLGQSAKEADNAFNFEQYSEALVLYKKAYSKTSNKVEKKRLMYQVAECYRLTNNYKKAESYYKRVIKAKYSDPIAVYYLAEVQRAQEKYQLAIQQYKKYIKLVPDDERAQLGLTACENAINWKKEPTPYQVENVKKINSREDDFAPAYADKKNNSIVFTSSRKDVGNKEDPNTGLAYTSVFVTQKDAKGNWAKPALLDEEELINTKNENNGAVVFNRKYSTIYFTRCRVERKQVLGCEIYTTSKRGKTWEEPNLLPIAPDSMKVGHSAISNNEKEIYFAANIENGKGGRDIWVAKRRRKNKAFEKPRNLGETINTTGDELYPVLVQDSEGRTFLYFSSNGHPGMGGLDMYKSELVEGKWTEPVNLNYPLNSSSDDFGIVFSNSRKKQKQLATREIINCEEMGFFTSNRPGGRGRFDIWEFWLPEIVFTLSGTVRDEQTLQYIRGAKVQMSGSDGSLLVTTTDQRGYYFFNKEQINKNTTYTLTVSKEKFWPKKGKESTVGLQESEDLVLDIKLDPIPVDPIPLPEIRYDLGKWDLKPQYQDSLNGLIKILKENPTIVIELSSHTDFRDTEERNNILSQNRAKEVVDFIATKGIDMERMVPRGYGESQPRRLKDGYTFTSGEYKGVSFAPGTVLSENYIKNTLRTKKQKEAAHQLNRRTEFRIIRDDYVPKNTNDSLNLDSIKIEISASVNKIPYEIINDTIYAECYINNNAYKFAFEGPELELKISLDVVMGMIAKYKINKSSFDNGAEAFTEDGTIKNGEKFVIQRIRIGDKTLYDQTAICVHGQSADVVIGDEVLSEFSNYVIDEDKSVIVFE